MKRIEGKRWLRKGVSLVELMIVVAIIGILATIGGVAYNRYVNRARIAKLSQINLDLMRGEESFYSRSGGYYPLGTMPDRLNGATAMEDDYKRFANLLEFRERLDRDTRVEVHAGTGGQMCALPAGCPQDTARPWFVVIVSRDFNADAGDETQVISNNELTAPYVLNEGE